MTCGSCPGTGRCRPSGRSAEPILSSRTGCSLKVEVTGYERRTAVGGGPRERGREADIRRPGGGEPGCRRGAALLEHRVGVDSPRAGGGVHGGDARPFDGGGG